jgi:hypothetical protein
MSISRKWSHWAQGGLLLVVLAGAGCVPRPPATASPAVRTADLPEAIPARILVPYHPNRRFSEVETVRISTGGQEADIRFGVLVPYTCRVPTVERKEQTVTPGGPDPAPLQFGLNRLHVRAAAVARPATFRAEVTAVGNHRLIVVTADDAAFPQPVPITSPIALDVYTGDCPNPPVGRRLVRYSDQFVWEDLGGEIVRGNWIRVWLTEFSGFAVATH